MIPGYSLLLVCVLPLPSAHEAAGATGIRHSPRPLLGERFINGSGALRGEAANARLDVIASQRVARMRAPLAHNDVTPLWNPYALSTRLILNCCNELRIFRMSPAGPKTELNAMPGFD